MERKFEEQAQNFQDLRIYQEKILNLLIKDPKQIMTPQSNRAAKNDDQKFFPSSMRASMVDRPQTSRKGKFY